MAGQPKSLLCGEIMNSYTEEDLIKKLSKTSYEEVVTLRHNYKYVTSFSADVVIRDIKVILGCGWTIDEFIDETARRKHLSQEQIDNYKKKYGHALLLLKTNV